MLMLTLMLLPKPKPRNSDKSHSSFSCTTTKATSCPTSWRPPLYRYPQETVLYDYDLSCPPRSKTVLGRPEIRAVRFLDFSLLALSRCSLVSSTIRSLSFNACRVTLSCPSSSFPEAVCFDNSASKSACSKGEGE